MTDKLKHFIDIDPKLKEQIAREGKTVEEFLAGKKVVGVQVVSFNHSDYFPPRATFNMENPPPNRRKPLPLSQFDASFDTSVAKLDFSFFMPTTKSGSSFSATHNNEAATRQRIIAATRSSLIDLPKYIRKKIEWDVHHPKTIRVSTEKIDEETIEQRVREGLSTSELRELAQQIAEAGVDPIVNELGIPVFQVLVTGIDPHQKAPPSAARGIIIGRP